MEQNIQPRKKTRKKITTVVIFLIILGVLGYWVGIQVNDWWQVRKDYIDRGLASDKFPFKLYTTEELAERGLYSESLYEDVPTRITPEETYAKFRQALIDEDFDTAAECFVEGRREESRTGLQRVKDQRFLQEMIRDLPERLEDTYKYTEGVENRNLDTISLASYYYLLPDDSAREAQTIFFVKNKHGDWLIEDL